MMDGLVSGRLYGDAEGRVDKAGKPFTVVKLRAASAEGELLFVNVIAFDPGVCTALAALRDGDLVSVTGGITPRIWTDKQGAHRPALDMVARRILALEGSPAGRAELR